MDKDDQVRHVIPSWDGNPAGWQCYQEQVRIWRLGENLGVRYSLAARLISRLSGAARRACISMPDEDLMPIRGVSEERDANGDITVYEIEADLSAGISNVMKRLRGQLHPEPVVSRGGALNAC